MKDSKLYEIFLPYPDMPDRRVRVFVPAHGEGELLPVIYMTDGQNLFDEESAAWGCWHTMEAVENERVNGLGAAVIVGIDHGGKNRDNELTPAGIGEVVNVADMDNFTAPEGEVFDRFVTGVVMPYIEENFPVKKGRKFTAFCGSSSGGLQSIFTGLEHRDRFSMLGVFSPAMLLYREEDIRGWLLKNLSGELPYIYLYTGNGDELEGRIFVSTELTYDILTELGYPYDLLNEVVMLEYRHNEQAWEEIFRDFLHTFIYRCSQNKNA